MSGRKKFNIWIAYSDLFTNLSTFLFISALGIFAAVGSGAFGQLGPNGSQRCTVASEIGKAMIAESELLEYIGSVAYSRSSCAEYYRVRDVAFVGWGAERGYFKRTRPGPPQDRVLKRAEILKDICTPIWLTIPRKDFGAHNGRLIIQGSGTKKERWPEPRCEQVVWTEPAIRHDRLPPGPPIRAVRTCDRLRTDGIATADPFCRDIEKCSVEAAAKDYTLCAQVEAVRQWHGNNAAACRREAAQGQAGTLYRACALAPTDPNFPDGRLAGGVMEDDARHVQNIPRYWAKVDFSAPIEHSFATPSLLESQPGGSIVVELRFSR